MHPCRCHEAHTVGSGTAESKTKEDCASNPIIASVCVCVGVSKDVSPSNSTAEAERKCDKAYRRKQVNQANTVPEEREPSQLYLLAYRSRKPTRFSNWLGLRLEAGAVPLSGCMSVANLDSSYGVFIQTLSL